MVVAAAALSPVPAPARGYLRSSGQGGLGVVGKLEWVLGLHPCPHPGNLAGKGGDSGCPNPWGALVRCCAQDQVGWGWMEWGARLGGFSQQRWEHWGSPDLPTAVRQGATGAAAAPFLPPPAPRLSPFPVSGCCYFGSVGRDERGRRRGTGGTCTSLPGHDRGTPGTTVPPGTHR